MADQILIAPAISPAEPPAPPGYGILRIEAAFQSNRREVRADPTEDRKVGGKMALHRLSPHPI